MKYEKPEIVTLGSAAVFVKAENISLVSPKWSGHMHGCSLGIVDGSDPTGIVLNYRHQSDGNALGDPMDNLCSLVTNIV